MLRQQSTILNMKAASFAAEQAIAGEEGTAATVGYLGADIPPPGRQCGWPEEWGLVAKIDTDEAFAPLRKMGATC